MPVSDGRALLVLSELPGGGGGDARAGKRLRRTFRNRAEAVNWQHDAVRAVEHAAVSPASTPTVSEAAAALLAGMDDGSICDRSGNRYTPSTVRSYRHALDRRVLPALGARRLADVRRRDVQALVDRLVSDGLSASTITNTLDPLRVIYRRAMRRDQVAHDPTAGLDLPSVRGMRDRIERPERGGTDRGATRG